MLSYWQALPWLSQLPGWRLKCWKQNVDHHFISLEDLPMMKHPVSRSSSYSRSRIYLCLLLVALASSSIAGWSLGLTVPADVALRVRLDDTLTSDDSRIGDPFSATVVDRGTYRNARVYGHISSITTSGRLKGNTTMMLRFDRLVMPDGRRSPIHAELVELYDAPSGEKVDVEGAIQSGGRGRTSVIHTAVGAGAGALLGGIFGGGKGAGIGSIVGGAGGLGTTAFHGRQKITLNSGLEMLIRTAD
jgi:hypothetical protein